VSTRSRLKCFVYIQCKRITSIQSLAHSIFDGPQLPLKVLIYTLNSISIYSILIFSVLITPIYIYIGPLGFFPGPALHILPPLSTLHS
jgi:hypothetical protein